MHRGDLGTKESAEAGGPRPDTYGETEPRGSPRGRKGGEALGEEFLGPLHPGCAECLGAVAHQLSQPLTALRGSMELALMVERSAAEYRAALKEAFQLAGHLAYLVASLRELAEAAAPSGAPQRVPLGAVAGEAVEALRSLAASRGVKTSLAARGEVPVCVPPEELRRAVRRLLEHVIQTSPEGGEIQISLSHSNGRACLTMTLPGQGARPSNLETKHGPSSPRRRISEAVKAGSLEWAIVQTLAETMCGTLQRDSEVPQGSRYRLCLPLAK